MRLESGEVKEIISARFGFKGLGKGLSKDPTSALARPYRLLLQHGKPIGTVNYVFFSSDMTYIVGSLCFTPAGRLLFFHGVLSRVPLWRSQGKNLKFSLRRDWRMDHITLEPDHQSAHITLLDSGLVKRYWASFQTYRATEPEIIYWFGLSVSDEKVLEPLPEEFEFQFRNPPSDSKRRLKTFRKSHENALPQVTLLPPEVPRAKPGFLHFDFILDTRQGASKDVAPPFLSIAPWQRPFLKEDIDPSAEVQVRTHQVTLSSLDGKIWINTSSRTGELSEPAMMAIAQKS